MTFIVHDDKSHHHQHRHVLFQLFHSFYLRIKRKSIICRLYFDLVPMKLNHIETHSTLFYSFNTNTFIISRNVCDTQCGCHFFFIVIVGVPILCASDLISFAYHLIIWYLIHRNWKCWLCCCVPYHFRVALRCDVQQRRKYKNDHSSRLFWNSLQNCQRENKKMWRVFRVKVSIKGNWIIFSKLSALPPVKRDCSKNCREIDIKKKNCTKTTEIWKRFEET